MARQIIDVFLSSTALDLEPHRKAIHAELVSTGLFHCVRQEDFGAQNAEAIEYCREKVKASDIFIGLIGHRRGWEPEGDNANRSITEMEHDWAKETGRRRYLHVAPDDFKTASNLRDIDELYARQQAFRKRVMDDGERIVSQKGFENPERFAANVVKHLLTQLVTGDLITLLRPELSPQSPGSPDEQRPAITAAVERLVEDQDVDLLALAKNPKNVELAELEAKLRERAEAQEMQGQAALKISAEYWRHIGALAFLHNTQRALTAYQKAVALDLLDPEGCRYLGELQYRLGDLPSAERSFVRLLELGKLSNDSRTQSIGSVRLGWIFQDRGDLTKAEALTTDAARFAESAEWKEGMARAYNNLGIIYQSHGDFKRAVEIQLKALKLEEDLGNREGMARASSNLGVNYNLQGDSRKAIQMQRKALTLYEEVGSKEGMAAAYINLGVVYDDLDQAEEMCRRGLLLSEELGIKEAMAVAYGNLGTIYKDRGTKAAMCDCWRKECDLYREMGLLDKAAEAERWLKLNKCDKS